MPANLRAAVGKREIKQSLGTKDVREAKRRYPAVAAEAERTLAMAERRAEGGAAEPVSLTLQQVVALSGEWYREQLAEQEPNPASNQEYDMRLSLAEDAADSKLSVEHMKPYLDPFLASKGLSLDPASHHALATRMFWDAVKLWGTLQRRGEGDYTPDPHLETFPRWELSPVRVAAPANTVAFEALIEGWALDNAPTITVKTNFTRHLGLLAKHLGHDDAARVERKDVIAFKEAELKAGKAPKTVSTELGGIGAVFSWAFKNEKIPANPAVRIDVAALKAAKRRGEKPRFPYSAEEAIKILQAARGETSADIRWLPWLCAFTGARISEVAGAMGKDIHEIDGQWYIAIAMDGRAAKTGSSRRRVPLHRVLIDEGFLKYAQTKGANDTLFSSWAGDKVARWIRGTVGITDLKKGPSHSWRHRFEDEGRSAGIEEDIRDALAGHKNARIGREYGTGYNDPRLLHRLVGAMEKITVPPELR